MSAPVFTREHLNPYWRSEYDAELQELWFQAVALRTNLFLLRKVSDFPFALLAIDPHPFWIMVFRGLYESVVTTLCRIALDVRRDVLTVQKLRDGVRANLRPEELRRAFNEHLNALQFDVQLAAVGDQAKQLRDNHLAHLNGDLARNPEKRGGYPLLPLALLQAACDGICALVEALSLDVGKAFDFIEYMPGVAHSVGTDPRPDIERLLDGLASESIVVRMPEAQPQYWADVWSSRLSPEDKATLNHYRGKFKLPPV